MGTVLLDSTPKFLHQQKTLTSQSVFVLLKPLLVRFSINNSVLLSSFYCSTLLFRLFQASSSNST